MIIYLALSMQRTVNKCHSWVNMTVMGKPQKLHATYESSTKIQCYGALDSTFNNPPSLGQQLMTAYQLYQSVRYAEEHEIAVVSRIAVVGGSEYEKECNKMCYVTCEKQDVTVTYKMTDELGLGLIVNNQFKLAYMCPVGALRNDVTPPFRWWIIVGTYLGAELCAAYFGVPLYLYRRKRRLDQHNSPEYAAYLKKQKEKQKRRDVNEEEQRHKQHWQDAV